MKTGPVIFIFSLLAGAFVAALLILSCTPSQVQIVKDVAKPAIPTAQALCLLAKAADMDNQEVLSACNITNQLAPVAEELLAAHKMAAAKMATKRMSAARCVTP